MVVAEMLEVDVAKMWSISAFVRSINDRVACLDIDMLVYTGSPSGSERSLQINLLSTGAICKQGTMMEGCRSSTLCAIGGSEDLRLSLI